MSWAGDPNVHTPNLDNMALNGIAARRGMISTTPLCCPARGTLLSGLYPQHCVPGHEHQMDPNTPTIAHAMQAGGYHTAYIGKWHLDGFKERDGRAAFHVIHPERRGGFDHWIGYENNNSQFDCFVHGDIGDGTPQRLPGFETDALTDLLIDHLKNHTATKPDQPFFGVLSVQPPHDPMQAPADQRRLNATNVTPPANVPPGASTDTFGRLAPGYYGMVENLDANVGRIMATLRELNISQNTIVIFFSDHGEMLGSHGITHKLEPLEESIRVPLIITGGDGQYHRRPPGPTDELIGLVDLAPTTCGLAGVPIPEAMQGTDFSFIYRGEGKPDNVPDSAFAIVPIPTGHGPSPERAWRCVITKDGWKYASFENEPYLLVNINDDPYEMGNLAHRCREKAKRAEMAALLQSWCDRTGDSFQVAQ
jgi:arylsulfatase A-like enzyme